MLGIVACETLYPEFERFSRPLDVEFVPQWYHEFPIHAPESARVHDLVQEKIDALEERGVDDVLVLYHDLEGVEGVRTESAPLHVFTDGDCIELFLGDSPKGRFGERKTVATYYLTRGWIDVGIDAYKVYKAYAGEIDELEAAFEEAAKRYPGLRVTWPESERIATAAARSGRMGADPGALLRDIVSCYHRVLLLDTGTLTPFHHEYAESFREFVARVGAEGPETANVSLRVIEGDTSRFEAVVEDPQGSEWTSSYSPGTPVDGLADQAHPPQIETD